MATHLTTETGERADPVPLTRCSLSRADFETVLGALEDDAGQVVREQAQDVLQLRAPRPWLEALDAEEDRRRG